MASARAAERTFAYAQRPRDKPPVHRPSCAGPTDAWLAETVVPYEHLFVLEDHAPVGGLGDALRRELDGRPLTVFAVEGWPACGTPAEALRAHGLDGESLADRIAASLTARVS